MLQFFKTSLASVCLATSLIAVSGQASAQNYDAAHQVRVGAFLQWAGVPGDVKNVGTNATGDFSFGSHGLGATAGLEWINKAGFSWGIEADGAAMSGNTSVFGNTFGTDYLATLRLRGGRHVQPDLFLYGTLGVGALGVQGRVPAASQFAGPTKTTDTLVGLVLGGGLEWDFGAGLLFGEYIYGNFGSATVAGNPNTFRYDPDIHAVRFGVKFKVGHDHYRDDVATRIGR
jgi:opacity protein-like surface antigen